MAASANHRNSLETILTYENRDVSDWSVIWSTAQVPGMDNAFGGRRPGMRIAGRRRLRIGALVLGGLLTMHCRVSASALTGGLFVFIILLTLVIAGIANPMRHFEVYLGQWSISGPGRAFRILPMLDGIGIAICINAIVRAINCCTVAAIAAVYVVHSVADAKLPFTYCRDFDLKKYPPVMRDYKTVMLQQSTFLMNRGVIHEDDEIYSSTVGLHHYAWRNLTRLKDDTSQNSLLDPSSSRKIPMCVETYDGLYPPLYSTPAYNFFYVEVVHLRAGYSYGQLNINLLLSILCVWAVIWILLIVERLRYGKLIWNNVVSWFVILPWIWVVCVVITGACNITSVKSLRKVFRITVKEIITGTADAAELALYIHSLGVGTEIIHGKGLNHYASGHIDTNLNSENVWHSCLLLLLAALNSGGAALCALVDYIQPLVDGISKMKENEITEMKCSQFAVLGTLWIIPMYSKCTSISGYSHLMSTIIFGGLMFSYMAVAFILLKTALHTIFEYRVKLVFVEQAVVAALILTCIGLSLLFATNGGIPLLESVEAIMTGVAVPYICCLELTAMLCVYRSHDFVSDMNVATEENACSSRIGVQWNLLTLLTLATLGLKVFSLVYAEFPSTAMYLAIAPLAGVLAAVPVRACNNAYVFLRPSPRQGT